MPTPSHEDLTAARAREDWAALWNAALQPAKRIIDRMRILGELYNVDWQELEQEGYLKAGLAIKNWDPAQATLGTYIAHVVRNHLRTYTVRNSIKSAPVDRDVDVEQIAFEKPTLDLDADHAARLLTRLTPAEERLVRRVYGIDQDCVTVEQIAVELDIASRTVKRMLAICIDKMRAAATA